MPQVLNAGLSPITQHEDDRRFALLLKVLLQLGGWTYPSQREAVLLDLACGECRESAALFSLGSSLAGGSPESSVCSSSRPLHLVGVDIRSREIQRARERAAAYTPQTSSADFIVSDGTALASHKLLPSTYDIVLFRHQNYWNCPRTWLSMFVYALEQLRPDGVIIITSYFEREHYLALRAFMHAGGFVASNVHVADARALPTPGKFVDGFGAVIVGRNCAAGYGQDLSALSSVPFATKIECLSLRQPRLSQHPIIGDEHSSNSPRYIPFHRLHLSSCLHDQLPLEPDTSLSLSGTLIY